jgi:Domain of unknown function (DUF5666)
MRISTWRVALTGGAIAILVAGGLGFAAASNAPAPAPANLTTAATTAAPNAGPSAGARAGGRAARLLRIGRRLVHAEITVNRDGQLVNLQLDHGTVQSIGSGTLTIAEAGGSTVTVSTDDATKVHLGRTAGKLADVKAGAEVFVRSLADGGTTLAKAILVIPAAAS